MSEFLGMKLKITLKSGNKITGRVRAIDETNQIITLEDALINNQKVAKYQLLGNTVNSIDIINEEAPKSSTESVRKPRAKPFKVKQIKQREEPNVVPVYEILKDPAIVSIVADNDTAKLTKPSRRSTSRHKWDRINQDADFDFESNLLKFNKEETFRQFKDNDFTKEENLLVSFNRRKIKHDKHVMPDYKLRRGQEFLDDESEDFNESDFDDRPDDTETDEKSNSHKFKTSGGAFLSSVTSKQLFHIESMVENECPGYTDTMIEQGGANLSLILINYLGGPRRFCANNRNLPPSLVMFIGNSRTGAIALCAARHLASKAAQVFVFLNANVPIKSIVQQKKLFLYSIQDDMPFHPNFSSLITSDFKALPKPRNRTADIVIDR
eukprot:NODE_316_length_11188_cov_0.303905.p3 type:complete len:381 gc:universal NODE_316_length_11188_cov_0.303905:5861-7003(+)